MTEMTDPHGTATSAPQGTPAASPVAARLGRRLPAFIASLLGGALAAGLGLGALAVLVMVLWISSPFPDSGPGGALRLAASLWFLGHGTTLGRASPVTGETVPLGLVPLLLPLLPFLLLHRAAREAAEPEEQGGILPLRARPMAKGRAGGRLGGRGAAVAGVCLGYLLVTAAALAYAADGDPAPEVPSALLHVPPFVALAVASGVWAARGRPDPLPALSVRIGARREVLPTVLRAATAAVLGLAGGGALLLATALSGRSGAARGAFDRLTDDWSGLAAVLLLAVALVPNAVLWAASYALGPGFLLGTGQPVALSGADPLDGLPPFPLLAALPARGEPAPSTWAVLALPLAAALLSGLLVGRAAAPVRPEEAAESAVWSRATTALTAACAALLAGLALGALATASAGPLGTGPLRDAGPVGWLTGAAGFVWTAFLGVPAALGLRAWRLRRVPAPAPTPAPASASAERPEPVPAPQVPGRVTPGERWWLPRREREVAPGDEGVDGSRGEGALRGEGASGGVDGERGVARSEETEGARQAERVGRAEDAGEESAGARGSGEGGGEGAAGGTATDGGPAEGAGTGGDPAGKDEPVEEGIAEGIAEEIDALLEGPPDRGTSRGEGLSRG